MLLVKQNRPWPAMRSSVKWIYRVHVFMFNLAIVSISPRWETVYLLYDDIICASHLYVGCTSHLLPLFLYLYHATYAVHPPGLTLLRLPMCSADSHLCPDQQTTKPVQQFLPHMWVFPSTVSVYSRYLAFVGNNEWQPTCWYEDDHASLGIAQANFPGPDWEQMEAKEAVAQMLTSGWRGAGLGCWGQWGDLPVRRVWTVDKGT